jgi:hypothetical protein
VANDGMLDYAAQLIVEDVALAAEINHQDGMPNIEIQILHHHDAQFFDGVAESAQRHIFADRVILAITAMNKKLLRRRPIILDVPVTDIGDLANAIEIAVYRFDLLAARGRRHLAGRIEKRLPGFEMAGIEGARIAAAFGNHGCLEIALEHAAPFGKCLEVLAGDFSGAKQFGIRSGFERRLTRKCTEQQRRSHPTEDGGVPDAFLQRRAMPHGFRLPTTHCWSMMASPACLIL